MQNQSLNGYWQVRQVGKQEWLPANVPGSVHTDLMAAGRLPDPFYGVNEEKVQWVAEKNWEYRKFFYPLASVLRQEKIWLVCDGLDTLAEVRLNGKILGQADNMYRSWRWDVKHLLIDGENKLEILFRSPVGYVKARERVKPLVGDINMGIRGGPYMRKTPSHFGWDWGPRLACVGIWQEIRLEGGTHAKLGDIRFDQEHTPGMVSLAAHVQSDVWEPADGRYTVRLRIAGPDQQVWQLDAPARPQTVMTVVITNPQLWWPNEMGSQALYRAEVELLDGEDTILDTRALSLGLRTVELHQEDDSHGRSFTFVVNGVPIFCKGANWIPVDSFPTRITADTLEALIRSAAETHQNMLRVWGGGYYESDLFYDLCDHYGILVWQDFQFACATYPLEDPAYLESVRCEVQENVRRLRHHAALALWCGNNEIEWLGTLVGWFKKNLAMREAYEQFFFHDLPNILAAEDPARAYWPASPSSNDPFNAPGSHRAGDAHLWEVYHEFRAPTYYRKQNPRFVSEFGFQGLPPLVTVEQFCPPEERRLGSRTMACHQRAMGGNPKLIWYLAQRFRLPRTFEGLDYLSQVFQAEVVRTGVEHWRQHPETTSGALYWQLNDCWPVISWASIDYFGRWKALQYAARRFYAPVLLSIEDETSKGQRGMNVWVSNDTRDDWQGRVHWTLETLGGEVIEGGDLTVLSSPQSADCLVKLDFARHNGKVNWHKLIFVAELWQGNERKALQMATFLPERQMSLEDPGLDAEMSIIDEERIQVRVSTQKLARFVQVAFEDADVVFDDNFFDLPAGRTRIIECALPNHWTMEQAQSAFHVSTLTEIGPTDSQVASHWKGDTALLKTIGQMLWQGLIRPALRK